MAMTTGAAYLKRMRKQKPEIFVGGKRIEQRADFAPFAPTLFCWGTWVYDCIADPEVKEAAKDGLSLTGEACHPFWQIPATVDDLMANIKVARRVAQVSPTAGYATIGRDELAALYAVSKKMAKGTNGEYHARVTEYVRRFQKEQIMTSAAITDPKGDRRLRPAEQPNKEAYLRVVDRNKDGIVVRGAKMHTSGCVAAEELVVVPTRAMRAEDADYAVAFAIPVDTPGLKMIARASHDISEPANTPLSRRDQLLETFTIFDDVLVPWDRVFMCGEWQFTGELAATFANVNRQGYLGVDVGKLDLFIGAAQRIAELNGVEGAAHIRDKITEMIKLRTLIWSTAVTASVQATIVEPGVAVPDPVYANTGKHVTMEGHYLATRYLLEIAGGSVITLPAVEDERSPQLKPYFDKFYAGATGSGADRIRMLRFIKDLAASEYSSWWDVEIIHGSGSPAAEWLQIYREFDLKASVAAAERASRPD